MMRDFNANTRRNKGNMVVGRFGEAVLNENGTRLIEICNTFSFKILNSFYQHRNVHIYTWTQPTGKTAPIIGYIPF